MCLTSLVPPILSLSWVSYNRGTGERAIEEKGRVGEMHPLECLESSELEEASEFSQEHSEGEPTQWHFESRFLFSGLCEHTFYCHKPPNCRNLSWYPKSKTKPWVFLCLPLSSDKLEHFSLNSLKVFHHLQWNPNFLSQSPGTDILWAPLSFLVSRSLTPHMFCSVHSGLCCLLTLLTILLHRAFHCPCPLTVLWILHGYFETTLAAKTTAAMTDAEIMVPASGSLAPVTTISGNLHYFGRFHSR